MKIENILYIILGIVIGIIMVNIGLLALAFITWDSWILSWNSVIIALRIGVVVGILLGIVMILEKC